MNETQKGLYEYIRDHPGCTYSELSRNSWRYDSWRQGCHGGYHAQTWPDHLSWLTWGHGDARITPVPRMVSQERGEDGKRRFWVLEGPFLWPWLREKIAAQRLLASLPEECRQRVSDHLRGTVGLR